MERLINGFKDLYACEKPVERHLMYASLFVIPAITGAIVDNMMQDTNNMATYLPFVIVFLLLSIVPLIYLLGFQSEFYELRLKGEKAIPVISKNLFDKGLKSLKLYLYWTLFFTIIVLLPVVLALGSIYHAIVGGGGGYLAFGILMLFLLPITFVCWILFGPFIGYIWCKFVKDYQYKAEYFNINTLERFMKKSFKETMTVLGMMILVGMVLGTVTSPLSGIVLFLGNGIGIAINSVLSSYLTGMVGLAGLDLYVQVYKNKIEPTENEVKV